MSIHSSEIPLPEEIVVENNLRSHVSVLASQIGERSVFTPGSLERSYGFIASQFGAMGFVVERESFEIPQYVGPWNVDIGESHIVSNVVAEIKGRTQPADIIVLGAHYDTDQIGQQKNPGANDNASGIAVMLEVARELVHKSPNKTIRFVGFVNEEMPFGRTEWQGATVHARKAQARGEKIEMAIILEEVGFLVPDDSSKDFLACVGYGPHLDRAVEAYDILYREGRIPVKLRLSGYKDPQVDGFIWPEDDNLARSDNLSFINHGYPSIMLTDTANFRYPFYHDKRDTPDKLNFSGMVNVTKATTQLVCELANM